MDNMEKKLDALIDALGFDVKTVTVRSGGLPSFDTNRKNKHSSSITEVIKLVDRKAATVPLPVHSEAWGCVVNFVISHRDDILNDVNDYGELVHILNFMERAK